MKNCLVRGSLGLSTRLFTQFQGSLIEPKLCPIYNEGGLRGANIEAPKVDKLAGKG